MTQNSETQKFPSRAQKCQEKIQWRVKRAKKQRNKSSNNTIHNISTDGYEVLQSENGSDRRV